MSNAVVPMTLHYAKRAAATSEVPVSAGELEIVASVDVTFALR